MNCDPNNKTFKAMCEAAFDTIPEDTENGQAMVWFIMAGVIIALSTTESGVPVEDAKETYTDLSEQVLNALSSALAEVKSDVVGTPVNERAI